MASQILQSVSREPPLLRWLHSHDPDRDITDNLLNASATFITAVLAEQIQDNPGDTVPPTASLFVPMYRRNQFVLGQLYGPMSPNAQALDMLSRAGYGTPPSPISRRFVIDLSLPSINFLEYEWFSDGKLCVSMHYVTTDGLYNGESIVLDSPGDQTPHTSLERHHLLSVKNRPSPTNVIMRMRIKEHTACQICYAQKKRCTCPPTMRNRQLKNTYAPPTNWETWISAFTQTRSGFATLTVAFELLTPMGNVNGSKTLMLDQTSELGVGKGAPNASVLLKMFMQDSGMLVSHPTTDSSVRSGEEKRDRIQLANELSKETDHWPSPNVFVLGQQSHSLGSVSQYPQIQHPTSSDPIDQPPPISEDSALLYQQEGYATPQQPFDATHASISPHPPLPHLISTQEEESVLLHVDAPITLPSTNDNHIYHPDVDTLPQVEANVDPRPTNGKLSFPDTNPTLHEQPNHIEKPPQTPVPNERIRISKNGNPSKRKARARDKLFGCECGRVFNHRGHYNEHRLCVHEKVRQHKCAFVNCQSRFFKKSDRDRHMRSKHDFTEVVCASCDSKFPDKLQLDAHVQQAHQTDFTCQKCMTTFAASVALRRHSPKCKAT